MRLWACIGNPPFSEMAPGGSTSDKPIYHLFMSASYEVSDRVELITPAKYLFNAGGTPKSWNKERLSDPHFKVLQFEENAKKVFPGIELPGGVAISYRNEDAEYTPIGTFLPYPELVRLKDRVIARSDFQSLSAIISGRNQYVFTGLMHSDHPSAIGKLSKGHANDIAADVFEKVPEIFEEFKPETGEYLRVLGRASNKRAYRWIKREYAGERGRNTIGKWKVLLPKANGASGTLGEKPARMISQPVVAEPADISTETFLSVGAYPTRQEAEANNKYLRTKFARALLGVLKITQDNTSEKWAFVPLQDFTPDSDIDWVKPIPEIDQQLYAKYELDQNEIDFIESHVAYLKEA